MPWPNRLGRLTRSVFDLRGNLVATIDPLGRPALRSAYDLAGQRLRTTSIDAGERIAVLDAAGNLVESRDAAGVVVRCEYDPLKRPLRVSVTQDGVTTVRERTFYGDSSGAPAGDVAAAAGLLGRPTAVEDEAGRLRVHRLRSQGRPPRTGQGGCSRTLVRTVDWSD